MPFVLDASVALAWMLPDEHSDAADQIADRLAGDFAVVPAIWPLEVLNALLSAGRRAGVGADDMQRLLADIAALPIEVEHIEMSVTFEAVRALAQQHGITSYDAAYLELAERRGLAIATVDRKLKDVAEAAGVRVIPGV